MMLFVAALPNTGLQLLRNIRRQLACSAEMWADELKARPLPPLYSTSVVYRPEPETNKCEEFADPYTVYERGWGDCDDLVIWRLAEIISKGGEAYPLAMRKIGTGKYHVGIRHADGKIEDPSLLLLQREKKDLP